MPCPSCLVTLRGCFSEGVFFCLFAVAAVSNKRLHDESFRKFRGRPRLVGCSADRHKSFEKGKTHSSESESYTESEATSENCM